MGKKMQGILKNGTPTRASIPFFETLQSAENKMLYKMSSEYTTKIGAKFSCL
jgi:hypothetical protein